MNVVRCSIPDPEVRIAPTLHCEWCGARYDTSTGDMDHKPDCPLA